MGRREEETAARRHDRHKASPSPLRGEEDEEAIRNRLRESGWRKRRADGENAPAAESLLDKEKALDRPEKSSPRAPDDRRSARASRRSRSPRRRDRERRSSRRKASASRRRSPSRSRSPASRSRSRSRTRSRSAGRRRHRHSSSSRKRRSSRSKSRSRDAKRSKRTSSRSASAAKHKNSLKEEKKEEKKKEGKDDDETETENEDVEKEKKDERHKPSSSSRKSRRSRSGSPSSPSRSSRRRRHRRNASHSRSASRSRRSRRGSSRSRSRSPRDRRSRGRDRRRRRYSRSRSPSYNRRRRRTARSSSRDRRRETNSSPEPHQHPPAATEAAPPAPVAPASAAPAPTGVNPTITQLMALYPTMSLQDIIAKMQASNVTMAAAVAQKPARELYVGNLPPNVTGPQLQEFLSTIIQQVGLTTQPGNPIVNTWISTDGHFAFCEMRSVEECNLALLLNQLSLLGQPLKFGRPRSFMGPPQQMPTISARAQTALVNLGCTPNPAWFAQSDVSSIGSEVSAPLADVSMLGATLAATSVTAVACANGDAAASPHRLIMSNIPIVLAEDQVKELVEPFGALKSFTLVKDTATGVSMGSALFQYEDDAVASQAVEGLNGLSIGGILLSVQRQPPGVAAVGALSVPVSNPEDVQSPVLKMANMISVDELRDDEEYADLAEDVEEECKRFGEVTGMEIPRPKDGGDVPGLGCIYVRFGKEEDSVSALKALNGRKFGGNIVKVTYFPLDKFEQRELS